MSREVRILVSDEGYRYLAVGHPSDEDVVVVPEHRLAAVAWGLLEGLDDEREIHHIDRSKTHTAESNLAAFTRDNHIEQHVNEALERGDTPPMWVINSLPFAVRDDLVDGDGELREAEGRT
jgi:hypothetical protein